MPEPKRDADTPSGTDPKGNEQGGAPAVLSNTPENRDHRVNPSAPEDSNITPDRTDPAKDIE